MAPKAVLFDMFDTLMMIEKDHAFYSPAVKRMHSFIVQNGIDVSFAAFRDAYIKARDALYDAADATMEEPHFNMRVKNALQLLGYSADENSPLITGATNAFCLEFMNYVRIDENAAAVLQQLHGKYRLGLVSNFAIPECVTDLLAQHNLDKLFEVIIVSGAVNRRKPNPDIYHYALKKMQLTPQETVFVGDTVDADIKGPKEIGMKTIYINRRPQKDLEATCPDQIITTLTQLPEAIQKC
ncbi:MAG: HAD family hydrolase [Candidatus Bathyarchaeota archaeon]|nr:HAD family hydrolase [Candidatus Bathyarchaeota archaeon]